MIAALVRPTAITTPSIPKVATSSLSSRGDLAPARAVHQRRLRRLLAVSPRERARADTRLTLCRWCRPQPAASEQAEAQARQVIGIAPVERARKEPHPLKMGRCNCRRRGDPLVSTRERASSSLGIIVSRVERLNKLDYFAKKC